MKILMLTDWKGRGGAAIAADRLACGLANRGHEIKWAAAHTEFYEPDVYKYTDASLAWQATRRIAGQFSATLGTALNTKQSTARIRQIVNEVSPDVISVHNIHAAGLPPTLPIQLSHTTPVVWTLHDMWAFTGGCTYSYDCDQFCSQCTESCPQAGHQAGLQSQYVPANYTARHAAFRRAGRIAFATPSQWLAQQAHRGIPRGLPIKAIPNSLDLNMFRPISRSAARAALGVPDDVPVIMSASASTKDPRKGGSQLAEALQTLRTDKVTWITLGQSDRFDFSDRVRHHPIAPIRDERLLSLAYNAADLHVLPTLADNLPNVLLEAAACGTPTVAHDVGGVSEAVDEDTTGWTVPANDTRLLADAIDRALALDADRRKALRESCRTFAENNFSLDLQADRYEQLFAQLLHHNVERVAA